MSIVVSILIAVAVAVALVIGSRLWFDRVQKRAHEQRIGIEVLNARRWREALDLLVQSLANEGLVQTAEVNGTGGVPLAERQLSRGGSRVLLIYKHGTSYHIGAAALLDAERRRQEAELDEVIIATLGSLDRDAISQAARMKITCLDGAMLWARVREVVDAGTRDGVASEAEALVERPRRLATAGSAVLGLAIIVWGGELNQLAMDPWAGSDSTPSAPVTAPFGANAAIIAAGLPATGPASIEAPATPRRDSTEQQQGAVARAVTTLPEIERASWSSASTLVVTLRPRVSIDIGVEKTCSLTARYPVLREVRLQMEASDGTEVRWRRCS